MSVHKIAPDRSEADDSLRAGLRAAIQARKEAEARIGSHRATTIANARRFVDDADAVVAAAQETVDAARAKYKNILARAAADGGPMPVSGVPAAQQALLNAQDNAELARANLAQLEGSGLNELQEEHKRRQCDVLAERRKVLDAYEEKMLPVGNAAKATLNALRQVLPMLARDDARVPQLENFMENTRAQERRQNPELEKAVNDFLMENRALGGEKVRAWEVFKAQLLDDADAEAPKIP